MKKYITIFILLGVAAWRVPAFVAIVDAAAIAPLEHVPLDYFAEALGFAADSGFACHSVVYRPSHLLASGPFVVALARVGALRAEGYFELWKQH